MMVVGVLTDERILLYYTGVRYEIVRGAQPSSAIVRGSVHTTQKLRKSVPIFLD